MEYNSAVECSAGRDPRYMRLVRAIDAMFTVESEIRLLRDAISGPVPTKNDGPMGGNVKTTPRLADLLEHGPDTLANCMESCLKLLAGIREDIL